jgi:hypothetical protein
MYYIDSMRSIAIISFLLCLLTGVCLAQDLVLNRATGTYVDSRGTPLSGNFRVEYGGQYVEEHQVVADYADFILRDGAPTKIMLYG